jgi:nitroreductase
MDAEHAIRTRRTHKAFGPEPVPRETVEELLELARWAPNHFLTQPWRFRVLGPETFERLVAAGAANEREKLGRAPTLVVASAKLTGDDHQNHEDVLATACAVYIVLLAAHARGLASYWRTPKLLQTPEGRAAVGLPDDEQFVALIHLGPPVTTPNPKPRKPPEEYVEFLP